MAKKKRSENNDRPLEVALVRARQISTPVYNFTVVLTPVVILIKQQNVTTLTVGPCGRTPRRAVRLELYDDQAQSPKDLKTPNDPPVVTLVLVWDSRVELFQTPTATKRSTATTNPLYVQFQFFGGATIDVYKQTYSYNQPCAVEAKYSYSNAHLQRFTGTIMNSYSHLQLQLFTVTVTLSFDYLRLQQLTVTAIYSYSCSKLDLFTVTKLYGYNHSQLQLIATIIERYSHLQFQFFCRYKIAIYNYHYPQLEPSSFRLEAFTATVLPIQKSSYTGKKYSYRYDTNIYSCKHFQQIQQ